VRGPARAPRAGGGAPGWGPARVCVWPAPPPPIPPLIAPPAPGANRVTCGCAGGTSIELCVANDCANVSDLCIEACVDAGGPGTTSCQAADPTCALSLNPGPNPLRCWCVDGHIDMCTDCEMFTSPDAFCDAVCAPNGGNANIGPFCFQDPACP